ncbi:hypothetical protein [Secundilactobacillus malefermentans]|uniref:Phage protein n=1 Tax=Secundilactobacillus malefermentans TaxID=176292 RepID=A0A4R5NCK1_9LACO|nr:hypothetical protein [Secundilactobacillus malefermentans]KRM56752.1 hypothetical protein FD44_GL001555 [Secundilactobacillus malefermentans DSM 5705 = KCTC 3548]QEA31792.1 hypothetical protein FGL90_06120 [Secundilactobacillus malefermentans]TDG70840.1 hypothetical protein C5L31_000408 [Secundilactobacillus malefermentans]
MSNLDYQKISDQLDQLRDYLRVLEEVDFVAAAANGTSSGGLTMNEVNDDMIETAQAIKMLEKLLAENAEQDELK